MTRSAQYWHSIVSQSVWRNYKISYQELQSVLYLILESVHFNCIYYAVKFQLEVMSACLCERDNWTCFVLVRLSDQSLPVWREGTCPATLLIGGADAASCSHSAMESQFFIKHSIQSTPTHTSDGHLMKLWENIRMLISHYNETVCLTYTQ